MLHIPNYSFKSFVIALYLTFSMFLFGQYKIFLHFYYPTIHFGHFGIPFGFIKGDFVFLTLFRSYSWLLFGPCKPLESSCGKKCASSCLFQVANQFYISTIKFGYIGIPFGFTICYFVFLTLFWPIFSIFWPLNCFESLSAVKNMLLTNLFKQKTIFTTQLCILGTLESHLASQQVILYF